ncbi:hypothetical protein [Rhizomonospora bruguierae]|uniref:hypothetical protein n=1 Tax=Rhizomonospora bruguierae TaxID=1581705 RepID=UPI001BD141B7|nr:hypothetical protein [Micromonospora sp. NBRC 107566]
MPPAAYRPHQLQGQVFRGSHAIARGLLTEHQLRSHAWIRLSQDVYADAALRRSHALQCLAVTLRLPIGAVIAGPSAACLHATKHPDPLGTDTTDPGAGSVADRHIPTGHDSFEAQGGEATQPDARVHVITPPTIRVPARRGLAVHVRQDSAYDITTVPVLGHPVPCTGVLQAAWDIALWLPPIAAVPVLDAMLHYQLLDTADLAAICRNRTGIRGARRARTAFAMTNPWSRSTLQSQLRVLLTEDGLPAPQLHCRIRPPFGGQPLLVDFAWPDLKVAVTYDADLVQMLRLIGWLGIYIPLDQPQLHAKLAARVRATVYQRLALVRTHNG